MPRCVFPLAAVLLTLVAVRADDSKLVFHVEAETGGDVPCRIHLRNSAGEPVRVTGYPYWFDHFVCSGRATLDLPSGTYSYDIERGPEHERLQGTVELDADGIKTVHLTLPRIANLRERGWRCADLHVHRPVDDIELLMDAEDLDYAPVITWWNQRDLWQDAVPETIRHDHQGRLYDVMAGEDEREGGALLYFDLDRPLGLDSPTRELPSPMVYVERARERNPDCWIDIEKPFWWDVPVWIASGRMNTIGLANNHMCRDRMLPNEAWGRARDAAALPPPLGNGWWTQQIYYHILNSGIRIPPSAGSASGVLPNPVGYNRVYVHCEDFNREAWWSGLAAGRCFVTNGPLLLVSAESQDPGHVFQRDSIEPWRIHLNVELTTLDHVPAVELVHNGRVVQLVHVEGTGTSQLSFDAEFLEDGWFLVRAVTDHQRTFRFASTGPFYLETRGAEPAVQRESVQFFIDWTRERIERVTNNVTDESQRSDVLPHHETALQFWTERLNSAERE